MQKTDTYIKNRNGLKLFVLVEEPEQADKLAFVTHGLSGSHDQPHIETMRKALLEHGYMVVSFDTAYSFGKSEGDSVHATASSYISDLEDVIAWAKEQDWFSKPFLLAGHSLGGITSLVYASKHPQEVSALFPMSTVVSGKLWHEQSKAVDPEHYQNWKEKGFYYKESFAMPGRSGNIGWGLAEDINKYDVLEDAPSITCPTLLVVGSEDEGTTRHMHELLLEKLGGPKELHVIPGMEHTPRTQDELDAMKNIFATWLDHLTQK